MNKAQNLEKTLKSNLIEAMSINKVDQYRANLKLAISTKVYSWFDLYYDMDKSDTTFVDLCHEYVMKSYAVEKDKIENALKNN
jgi:predicted membrane GTPase involved in stress response